MKLATVFLTSMVVVTMFAVPVMAQSEGDYRTRASGDWNAAQNWERFNGTSWVAVATPPSGSEVITVLAADSIFVNVAVTVTGRLANEGRVAEDGLLTIGDGGVYEHARDSGTIPEANWAEGSTLHVTGVTATAPADRNQPYHHIILETPGLLSNLNMNLNDVVIGGDITVLNSGQFGNRWYLTSAAANDTSIVTIMGDVIVEAGQFSVHGTSNANTVFVVDHYGDVVVTGGNFSISRGSQALGTTTWILHEGDFSMSNATTQNSTVTPFGAAFVFASGETQTLTLGEGNTLQALPIEVVDGTTLDMGTSTLAGSGHFLLEEGAILGTALPGGISAIFTLVVGEVTLEDDSGFLFNGTSAQVTSARMPQTVGELIIDNPAGVTLSQETTINDVLRLRAGVFDNTIPFELGPEGYISFEGGSLLHPVSAEPGTDAGSFLVEQNYPNPFSSSTSIRFNIPAPSNVSVTVYNMLGQQVMTAFDGQVVLGGEHQLSIDLADLSSGIYFYRVQTEFGEATKRMMLIK